MTDNASRFSYQQLADELRSEIARGQLKAGAKLPSIRGLAERYGIAPQTVQSALKVLLSDGLIYADSTRGYFVADSAQDEAQSVLGASRDYADVVRQLDALTEQVRELGRRVERLERERS